jgi:hypothetical protein
MRETIKNKRGKTAVAHLPHFAGACNVQYVNNFLISGFPSEF